MPPTPRGPRLPQELGPPCQSRQLQPGSHQAVKGAQHPQRHPLSQNQLIECGAGQRWGRAPAGIPLEGPAPQIAGPKDVHAVTPGTGHMFHSMAKGSEVTDGIKAVCQNGERIPDYPGGPT